jgi:hypothetical protein
MNDPKFSEGMRMFYNIAECKAKATDPSITAWTDLLCDGVGLIVNSLIVLGFVGVGFVSLWLLYLAALYVRRLVIKCRGDRAHAPISPTSPPPAPAASSDELRYVSQASCIVAL